MSLLLLCQREYTAYSLLIHSCEVILLIFLTHALQWLKDKYAIFQPLVRCPYVHWSISAWCNHSYSPYMRKSLLNVEPHIDITQAILLIYINNKSSDYRKLINHFYFLVQAPVQSFSVNNDRRQRKAYLWHLNHQKCLSSFLYMAVDKQSVNFQLYVGSDSFFGKQLLS